MTKVRQDAWSHEDDLLLAETVLRHIREGSTQLDAFEEVGDKLNRTGAACGFRWNAIVRRKYDKAIELAKKQRKQLKRAGQRRPRWQPPVSPAYSQDTMDLDAVAMEAAEETVNPTVSEVEEVPVSTQSSVSQSSRKLTMNDVILYLENLQTNDQSSTRLLKENEALKSRNSALEEQVARQEKEIAKLEKKHQTIEEDYQSLISIMDRARRMVMLQDESDGNSPAFKMDKNGNLEKLAK